MNWREALNALHERGEAGVLVTVAAARGHTPREAGAKMLVGAGHTWDSVGGGNLEATAVARARALLAAGERAPELLTLRLTDRAPNEHGRQCCGGEVTLLLEPFLTARPAVAVFGAGHVGLELARLLSRLPLALHLIDSRAAQLAPERLAPLDGGAATLHVHHAPIPETVLADLPPGTHLRLLTHDHAEDAALLDAALRRPDWGSVGLIGSSAKWARFQGQLAALGHPPDALARVITPIGLPALMTGPARKHPAMIALAVAAELAPLLFPEGPGDEAP
ncbi:xanthine dehydrogenase accessory protein XdhC [Deinococcus multiflagellatus]|uniref:xanthine dehydrogenase accessory protein XdhC n=1 Tax=Deinococcus multiflagellatus TaxID=1656887 RepID=UPI001CCA04D4|nr:xanthine dehydrogenase accessory protein XdhC [Deinococcus multiflagellatus]MBZ9715033.1 xanthine dehydrogenase accessory protein XdhC [Deinococcus multiflagellatus]